MTRSPPAHFFSPPSNLTRRVEKDVFQLLGGISGRPFFAAPPLGGWVGDCSRAGLKDYKTRFLQLFVCE